MKRPRLKLELALSTDPLATTPVWTDVSSYLTDSGQVSRAVGRAGTMNVVVDNSTDAFNPWNYASPLWGNLLTASQSIFHTGWAAQAGGNVTVGLGTMTSIASGQMSAETPRGTSGMPVVAGATYSAFAQFQSVGTGRVVGVGVTWFNSAGVVVSSALSPTVFDGSSGYTQTPAWNPVAPATAAYANLITYVTTGSAGEAHFLRNLTFRGGTSTMQWETGAGGTEGQLVPMRKARLSAEWNLLTASQSIFHTGWAAQSGGNVTVGLGTMTSIASGQMSAETPRGTSGITVTAGDTYSIFGQFRSSGTGRVVGMGVTWFNSAGTLITGVVGPTVFDGSGSYTQTPAWNPVAPATAAYASLVAYVTTGTAGEQHLLRDLGMFPTSGVTVWAEGGVDYLFTGYVETFAAEWEHINFGDTTIGAVDGNKVLTLVKPAGSDYNAAVLVDTPAGYFPFNELGTAAVSGLVTLEDSSGFNRDGTYKNSPDFLQNPAVPSEVGTSVKFSWGEADLAGAHAEVPSATCPSGTTNFTVEGWVKPLAIRTDPLLTTINRVWFVQSPGSQILTVTIWNDGRVHFYASDGANGGVLNSTTALTLGRSNHIACVKSGTTGPANWAIYIDGVDVSDHPGQTLIGTGNCNLTAAAALLGGRTISGVARGALDGYMDEFAIYHTALSSARVTAHYAASYDLAKPVLTGARIGKVLDLIDWPAADRVLDAGQYLMQQVTEPLYDTPPYGYFDLLVESEGYPSLRFFDGQGRFVFQDRAHATPASSATFSDASSTLYYDPGPGPVRTDRTDLWTRVVYQADDGQPQVAEDATAAGRFVGRTLTRTGLKNASDANVATLAASDLVRFKTARDRIDTLVLHPLDEPEYMWPQVLNRELGEVVTVTRTDFPGNGAPFTGTFRIVGIDHRWSGADWHTTWTLEPT